MRSYCAGKGRVIASAQDAAALGEWPRLRGPDTVIAELLRINPEKPEQDLLRYAAEKLTRGCVVAIPTDTLYGLAADPFNLAAVDEIYRVKGRPEARALPILVNSVDQAILLSRERIFEGSAMEPLARRFLSLAHRFWPGALTLVVEA